MWFGVMLAVLVELIPKEVRTSCLAISTFTIANIAGNLPVLVAIIKVHIAGGLRTALMIMYPGFYFLSKLVIYRQIIDLKAFNYLNKVI